MIQINRLFTHKFVVLTLPINHVHVQVFINIINNLSSKLNQSQTRSNTVAIDRVRPWLNKTESIFSQSKKGFDTFQYN